MLPCMNLRLRSWLTALFSLAELRAELKTTLTWFLRLFLNGSGDLEFIESPLRPRRSESKLITSEKVSPTIWWFGYPYFLVSWTLALGGCIVGKASVKFSDGS